MERYGDQRWSCYDLYSSLGVDESLLDNNEAWDGDGDALFPNTSIQLQHVGGEKYGAQTFDLGRVLLIFAFICYSFELQRGTSVTSATSGVKEEPEEDSESARHEVGYI